MSERVITVFVVLFIALVVFCFFMAIRQQVALYDECIADGHKSYECHGMLGGRR